MLPTAAVTQTSFRISRATRAGTRRVICPCMRDVQGHSRSRKASPARRASSILHVDVTSYITAVLHHATWSTRPSDNVPTVATLGAASASIPLRTPSRH